MPRQKQQKSISTTSRCSPNLPFVHSSLWKQSRHLHHGAQLHAQSGGCFHQGVGGTAQRAQNSQVDCPARIPNTAPISSPYELGKASNLPRASILLPKSEAVQSPQNRILRTTNQQGTVQTGEIASAAGQGLPRQLVNGCGQAGGGHQSQSSAAFRESPGLSSPAALLKGAQPSWFSSQSSFATIPHF